ncbi:RNA polymerase sigma factor [Streptomyces sp. NPDC058612]|uniref:RNA polymerase sigma factor n=1 Tax=Streptomyces sp. NPDC058612 TaxID=3346555 RepID=UPI003669BDA2
MADTETTRLVNAEALAVVHREYWGEMTAVAARLLRDRDVPEAVIGAQDLVQTAFERALRATEVLREPRAYIYTILRREVAYWAERLHQEREWEAERLAELRTSAKHGRDVGITLADRITVEEALRRLSQQQATAVALAKMYGFTQHETARMTGRHPGTVAVHIARAVAHLTLYLTPVLLIVMGIWVGGKWSVLLIMVGSAACSVYPSAFQLAAPPPRRRKTRR